MVIKMVNVGKVALSKVCLWSVGDKTHNERYKLQILVDVSTDDRQVVLSAYQYS